MYDVSQYGTVLDKPNVRSSRCSSKEWSTQSKGDVEGGVSGLYFDRVRSQLDTLSTSTMYSDSQGGATVEV